MLRLQVCVDDDVKTLVYLDDNTLVYLDDNVIMQYV